MLRERLTERSRINNSWYSNPRSRRSPSREYYKRALFNEWRLALYGLVFSLWVITAKIIYANRNNFYNMVFERRLVAYETVLTDGDVMFNYAWSTIVKFSWFWFPILCGVLATWFTWMMVYLDSEVPGVLPPSPLSPSKYKIQSGHTFHLNYIFAVVVGFLVFIYMYMKGIALRV